ncbi:hypothetical protein EJ357_35350 [Streptomyces cyaneochromogenes]|uniref:Uncharacterized protein n=1 Tax=Streptomyces cyaneochromogenes TaxID=2496836 RepID=A0A3Q9EXF8_9ACTN|nr:hypothetical protein [Streptomyces cyaneochromogenes]AZQ38085.1 hypothetical protein EJ357_35350 [Streptomyces cyaneochromogenes]
MRDHRQEIADALADSTRTDRDTAHRVLAIAVHWAANSPGLPDRASDDGAPDGADALTALFAMDDALTDALGLADALPGLLEAARPGESVKRRITELMDKLTAAAGRVTSERAALAEFLKKEEELRRCEVEHEKLRREVEEFRRLERLAEMRDQLRAQREALDTRFRELRARNLGALDEELRTAADALLQLTEEQLAVLEPRTRQALEQAVSAQEVLANAEYDLSEGSHQLAADQDRLERIQAEQGKVFTSLARYAQADRELAQALRKGAGADTPGPVPGQGLTLEEVEDLTRTIEQQLIKADEILGRILTAPQEEDGGTRITGTQP